MYLSHTLVRFPSIMTVTWYQASLAMLFRWKVGPRVGHLMPAVRCAGRLSRAGMRMDELPMAPFQVFDDILSNDAFALLVQRMHGRRELGSVLID
jgi:hypothetical protein